jgi:thiamine transporter
MPQTRNKTRILTFSAMAIALAVVASYIKVFEMPMGGSVTPFSMLFAGLAGYWYGPAAGLSAGVAYGLLQFALGPYVVHPAQVLLDYPLAFGALGLTGLFHKRRHGLVAGYAVGVLGRFFFSTLSGVVFFSQYAYEAGMRPVTYSALYNGAYLGAEGAATVALLMVPAVAKALAQVKALANGGGRPAPQAEDGVKTRAG